jgi:SAM-dependent methyltransferase
MNLAKNTFGISDDTYSDEFLLLLKELLPKGRILDLGCGEGFIAKKLKDYEWYGLDINPIYNSSSVYKEVKISDMKKIPYKDNVFDAVTSFQTLHHEPHRLETVLKEIKRVLKKNGVLILLEPNKDNLGMRFLCSQRFKLPYDHLPLNTESALCPDVMIRLLKKIGFLKIERIPIGYKTKTNISISSKTGNPLYSRMLKSPIVIMLQFLNNTLFKEEGLFLIVAKVI